MGVVIVCAALFLLAIVVTAVCAGAAGAGHRSSRCAGHERPARKVFTHLQRLGLDYYTEEKAGVIMTRMTSDIENLQQLLQDGLAQLVGQALTMVVITVILFTMNVELTLITLALVIPILTLGDDLVQPRLRAGLPASPRTHRRRARRPLGEPARCSHRRRVQPPALERRRAPQHRRRLPRRQQPHGPDQRHLRPRHADARVPRAGVRCWRSAATWCCTTSSRSAPWSPSSST